MTSARILVHGHRGARARFPENTLPAFAHALAAGVDALELDLVVTADDQLAVTHDPVLDPQRCRQPDGRPGPRGFVLRQHTLAELKAFDCGATVNPEFPAQQAVPHTRVPTLQQVIELVQSSVEPGTADVILNIEAKIVPGRPGEAPHPGRFAELIVDQLKQHKMVTRAMVQSFDHRVLQHIKRLQPALRTSALVHRCHPDLVAVARAAGADAVSPHHEWITRDDVVELHKAGRHVVPWTANLEPEWDRLVTLGVDAIITDDPQALISYLRQRGLR